MSDESRLVEQLRQRDPQAFEAVFQAHADRLYRLALSILDDPAESDCVVQDSFVRLFEHLDRFEGRASLGTWLYRVAYNASIDRVRRRKPTVSLADDGGDDDGLAGIAVNLADWGPGPERQMTNAELHAALARAIADLPESLRVVFVMREIDGLTTAESADLLNISEGALKVRLHRARLRLRESLAGTFTAQLTSEEPHP